MYRLHTGKDFLLGSLFCILALSAFRANAQEPISQTEPDVSLVCIIGVGDMMLGHALDSAFNNGPAPFGCQSDPGNLCALDGTKQLLAVQTGPNTIGPQVVIPNNLLLNNLTGAENPISWGPHPNPPPLAGSHLHRACLDFSLYRFCQHPHCPQHRPAV